VALDEQAKVTKAGAIKQFVECAVTPQELKLQRIRQWGTTSRCPKTPLGGSARVAVLKPPV